LSIVGLDKILVKIARLYYEQDLTQMEIAKRLRLSRPKVQRLLQRSRDEGIVQVIIRPVMSGFDDLESKLEKKFGLQEAVVVETTAYDDQSTIAREVGTAAAEYLMRVVQSNDRIVISWGGSLLRMVDALGSMPRTVENVTVIQGLGGIADPSHEAHATILTTRMAHILGGVPILLPAPGVAGSVSARDAFYADHYVQQVLATARSSNLAIMGIGAPRRDSLLVGEGNIVTWEELSSLVDREAVGDINLRYFNCRGEKVESDLDKRVIGLTIDELKKIDRVVGVAGGSAKLSAISGVLAGNLLDVLVTDHMTAKKLLDEDNGNK
jgi:DNA-binding transcriptional regulator LsrR (DeoR family)